MTVRPRLLDPDSSDVAVGAPWRAIRPAPSARDGERGSVLVIVLWICFGLVALTLYFAQSMNFELRATEQRNAALGAAQAIQGAARYASNVLVNVEEPGLPPDPLEYEAEAVPVGEAAFWFLGRDVEEMLSDEPWFGLVDEASKLNLNTATAEMLELLPGMTPEFAAAIVDWRDSDSDASGTGTEDGTYERLVPAYQCKNAPFESIEELRMLVDVDLELLYGEDTNLNGILDPNENDGESTPPDDNQDGRLDPGILEYLTIYTRQPATAPDGSTRINVASTNQTELASLLQENFGTDRANAILQSVGVATGGASTTPGGGGTGGTGGTGGPPGSGGTGGAAAAAATSTPVSSLLEFYLRSGMTSSEFGQIEANLTVSTNSVQEGLVNVNTASEAVLACIPGIGLEYASSLVASRPTEYTTTPTLAWVADVLGQTNAVQAGPYLTSRSYQFSADVCALGRHGRGFQRVRYVFDTSAGNPRIVARQDRTSLGWALGRQVREELWQARETGVVAYGETGDVWRR